MIMGCVTFMCCWLVFNMVATAFDLFGKGCEKVNKELQKDPEKLEATRDGVKIFLIIVGVLFAFSLLIICSDGFTELLWEIMY